MPSSSKNAAPAQPPADTPADLMRDMDAHLAAQSAEVVPATTGTVLPRTYGLDYITLVGADTVDTIEGFDLVKSENKHTLIGVPFVIVGVTYRPGIAKNGQAANYVSVELVTAPMTVIMDRVKAGRVLGKDEKPLTEPMVGGNETLVINDGSTGIARQVTEYLHRKGLINVGAITEDMFTGGEMGTSPWDRYFEEWPMGADAAARGFKLLPPNAAPLHCPRGLRVSAYPNPLNPKDMSYTYYLA